MGYEGLGCLAGGSLLIAAPGGKLMNMPVALMRGAFPDFMIPGVILFLLGIMNVIGFVSVFRRQRIDWLWSGIALGGLLIWFWVEIAIILELHWLHAMWGLPVVLGIIMSVPLFPKSVVRKTLLVCGICSSLLYAVINIIVPAHWPAYSVVTQTVSELSAINAPTRTFWIILCAPFTILVIAFAMGIRISAGSNRLLRLSGTLLLVYGALGILWPFAPMHLREALAAGGSTFSDTMHITLGVVTEVIYLIALGVTAAAIRGLFRIYSIGTFILLFIFGALTFAEAPNIAKNQPTPMIGVWERINIGVFLVWVVVLAIILLRRNGNNEPVSS